MYILSFHTEKLREPLSAFTTTADSSLHFSILNIFCHARLIYLTSIESVMSDLHLKNQVFQQPVWSQVNQYNEGAIKVT